MLCGIPEKDGSINHLGMMMYKTDIQLMISEGLHTSLSTVHGCLLHGNRVVIPSKLQPQVLQLLHSGHFGMQ